MKRKKWKLPKFNLLLLILLAAAALAPSVVVKAASATVTLETDTPTVTEGEDVQVTIRLSSDAILGDFDAFLAYNDDVLEFKEGASFVAGGDGLLKITDMTATGEEKTRKYVINFTAKKAGSAKITLKDDPEIYDYESGDIMSVSSNDLAITVAVPKNASANADLKTLKISPGTLTPEFSKGVTEYETKVSSEIQQLIISAVTEDKGATVTVQGNQNLEYGSNSVTVTVKAESGHIKKYHIEVYREEILSTAEETAETAETGEETAEDGSGKTVSLDQLTVEQDGSDVYISNGFRYKVLTVEKEADIPEGYTSTSLKIQGVTITVYIPTKDPDSEFLLLYAENENGEKGFYQYDRVESTVQRYNKNQSSLSNQYVLSDEIMQSEEYKSKITTLGILVGILGALLITMSILLIHAYTKQRD